MEKEFVNYSEALALKELGFDEPCLMVYNYKKQVTLVNKIPYEQRTNQPNPYLCTAPLFQQAFRWFREKHNINGHFWDCSTSAGPWCFTVKKLSENMYESLFICEKCRFKTPEEAELECLKKLISIVKEK